MDRREGDQFLLEAYTCQASRQDEKKKNVLCTYPRSSLEALVGWLQPAQHKAPPRDPPLTWLILPPAAPTFPAENPASSFFPKSQCRANDHFDKQNPRIIQTLLLKRLTENTQVEDWSSDSIPQLLIVYSQAWVRMLSDSLSNLIPYNSLCRCYYPHFPWGIMEYSELLR